MRVPSTLLHGIGRAGGCQRGRRMRPTGGRTSGRPHCFCGRCPNSLRSRSPHRFSLTRMPASTSRPADPSPAPWRLSETTQAAVSVAIGVYLVGLVLSILGNSVSGSSALVRTIKGRLFSPWMTPAWLDLGFDHPFTYGRPEDSDHVLEVRDHAAAGADAAESVIRFPATRTKERASRWRRLARSIAMATAEDAAAPLAAGVGEASFALIGSEDLTVRVLRQTVAERTAPRQPPRFEPVYAARVRRVDGELQLVELGDDGKRVELAPLTAAEPDGS